MLKIQNNYQNTQNYFNLGCDFIVTSKTFKDIIVPQDSDSKWIFMIKIKKAIND
ncbi:hypothetical protein [Helicobacter sp. MIT 14-3879]|uniref:hypothetical protein n=1 Tax=Helicobacter sp. MIT 14-3879 TaxID=2040649 RepID=UPI0015F149FE|nr:hypothetical protein [Helicobacter sp. MIT 14-3879]